MLNVLRKHASSWIIKVILGAIIVTFIFFFGYSSFKKGMRGGRMGGGEGGMALKVNGAPVSISEYDFFFNRSMEQIKSSFKDQELPEIARKIAQSSTIRQLIGREIVLQQADALGLVITDQELADVIRRSQSEQKSGEFDPIAYRHQFLPSFSSHYGLDYESFVRQDLRIAAFQAIFARLDGADPLADAADKEKDVAWTFEAVSIDPKALVDSKAAGSPDEVLAEAKKLVSMNPGDWKKTLAKFKVEPKRIGPIKISERRQLLDGAGLEDDYTAIFALTKERPMIDRPIERGGKIYVVGLVERAEKQSGEKPASGPGRFLDEWMTKLSIGAKVQDYVEKQQ
ncbi:MAG: SurA N-terminal domain-containing protein [Pseudomonadota bacterium]